jgi:subtilisin-like proprotein convertase family protein
VNARLVVAAAALLAASSSGCALYNGIAETCDGAEMTATVNMTIPDANSSGINSVINPPYSGRPSKGIGIELNVDHPFESDLSIHMAHGNNVIEIEDLGDNGPFRQWDGIDVAGAWTMNVADTATRDVGYWTDWKLVICGE